MSVRGAAISLTRFHADLHNSLAWRIEDTDFIKVLTLSETCDARQKRERKTRRRMPLPVCWGETNACHATRALANDGPGQYDKKSDIEKNS